MKLRNSVLTILISLTLLSAEELSSTNNTGLPIPDSVTISLNVKDVNIRDLLQGIAVQNKLNLFIDNQVQGIASANFNKFPLKQALQIIIQENGYEYTVDGTSIVVKPKSAPIHVEPQYKIEIQSSNNLVSIEAEKVPLSIFCKALSDKTKTNIISDHSINSNVSFYVNNMPLDKALKLFAESNNLQVSSRKGAYIIGSAIKKADGFQANSSHEISLSTDSLVSIDAKDAQIQSVLANLVEESGISTVVYGQVVGNVTANIRNVPIREALKYIFRGTPTTFWVMGGIYFIGPQTMQSADNSDMIRLKHMKAEDVLKLLPSSLIGTAQIQVVKSQNSLMVVGAYERIDAITQYIEKMDKPIAQILLEVTVLDVDIEKANQLGVDMFIGGAKSISSSERLFPGLEQTLNRNQANGILGAIGLSDIIDLPKDFAAKVSFLAQKKVLTVKAVSQIATLNGETAVLTIGQTQFFLLKSETDYNQGDAVTAKTTERFEKIEANSTITVTPFVTGENEVTCEIIPDFSEPEGSFDAGTPPTLNKRYVKSSLRLRHGQTIVLGGMVKESLNRIDRQVPFLGDLPFVGWLFKSSTIVNTQSQLRIFVTPRIYYGNEESVDIGKVTREFDSKF